MKRRDFITLIGGAMTWPLAARAQQPGRLPTIGFLGASTPSAWSRWSAAFVQRLRELGWTDGRTVAIEYRWADGRNERFSEIAAEFAALQRVTREHVARLLAAREREGAIRLTDEPEVVAAVLLSLADGLAMRLLGEPDHDHRATLDAATSAARALIAEP